MNSFGYSKERERDATVALLGPIEAQHNANAAIAGVDMDRPTADYDSLQQNVVAADRAVNATHRELYGSGYSQAEVINGTGKAISIVKSLNEDTIQK